MSLDRMPVFAWAMLIVGVMIVFAFPAIIAGTALLELERAFDWPLFDAERGGDPLLWQHLFWFFGHPEVYIIFLPAAGLVSMIVPALAGTPLAGRRAIVAALLAVGFFSFALWAHHMFTAGLGNLSLSLVSAASLAVAVPAGIQVFAWIATLWRGRVRADTPMLFVLGFLFSFVLGGLTGVMVAVLPFDWQAHDSYFVVAHLHYVLIGGALFPVLAALCYWLPLVNGHRLDERAGRWSFGLIFGGFQLAFFPMHIAGLLGMPRRVATYEAGLGWEWPNLLSSIGAAVLGAGMALFTWGIVKALRRPAQPHGDPWHAPTLEWLPSADYGPRSIPQVDGSDPLWRHPRLADEVVQGRHWLPGTATGARETLVTTPRAAVLHHLVVLPGDSALPLVAAIGTAGFFLLLTVKWVVAATAFGVAAVVSTLLWLWETDRPAGAAVEVAEGVRLPVGARLTQSPSWWATVIYLVVDVTVLASIAFSHLHVALLADVCPPAAAALPAPGAVAGSCAAAVLSAGLLWWSGRPLDERALGRWRCVPVLAAFALAAVAFAVLLTAHGRAGLEPTAQAWSATVAALLAYQGWHVAVQAIVAAYLGARIWRGLVTPRQRATFDNILLLWLVLCAQGIVVAAWPHLVVGWLT
jgi:cytochrome c oxidase subunit I+III